MPLDEFWHGDMRLFACYEKAYYRDKSFTAWQEGARCFEAFSKAIYNAFGKKRASDKSEQYEDWKDPTEKMYLPKITKANAEEQYRKQQADQMGWFFNR